MSKLDLPSKDMMDLIAEVKRRAREIKISPEELAGMIDHTLLHPNRTKEDFRRLCNEAKTYGFHSVCVNPYWVRFCSEELRETDIRVVSVAGFPLGQSKSKIKATEVREAIGDGASEIDMVMNIAALKDGDHEFVKEEIEAVVDAAAGNIVKVILETGYLNNSEIIRACEIAKEAGAHFVKTSTGFGPIGATVSHVYLMRKTVGDKLGVKAAGGIKNSNDALRMIAAGANRIGASQSTNIIDSYRQIIRRNT